MNESIATDAIRLFVGELFHSHAAKEINAYDISCAMAHWGLTAGCRYPELVSHLLKEMEPAHQKGAEEVARLFASLVMDIKQEGKE